MLRVRKREIFGAKRETHRHSQRKKERGHTQIVLSFYCIHQFTRFSHGKALRYSRRRAKTENHFFDTRIILTRKTGRNILLSLALFHVSTWFTLGKHCFPFLHQPPTPSPNLSYLAPTEMFYLNSCWFPILFCCMHRD